MVKGWHDKPEKDGGKDCDKDEPAVILLYPEVIVEKLHAVGIDRFNFFAKMLLRAIRRYNETLTN